MIQEVEENDENKLQKNVILEKDYLSNINLEMVNKIIRLGYKI